MNRIPAPASLAIDPRPFGYLDPEYAERRRESRRGLLEDGRRGYPNSEARKRIEKATEHACYRAQGEHAL